MNTSLPKQQKLVLISEAASILGVSIDTVRRWDKSGILHSERVDGKNRYFSIDELEKIKLDQPLSISEASKRLGISTTTLRRLEGRGLLVPDRNKAGERVYTKDSLQKFLNSEYYLRQKQVEEKILEPLKHEGTEETVEEKTIEEPSTTTKILGAAQEEIREEVSRLVYFKRSFYGSGIFLATTAVLLIFIITILFLLFPEDSAQFFGYKKTNPPLSSDHQKLAEGQVEGEVLGALYSPVPIPAPSSSGQVLGAVLKPLSNISLGIVKTISPDTYQKIVPQKVIADVNDILTIDEEGNITPLYNIKFPDSSYLEVPDAGLIENFNASYIRGKVIPEGEGEIAVIKSDGTINNLLVNETNISPDSIVTIKIKDGAVTTSKISDGAVTSEKLAAGLSVGGSLTDDSVLSKHIKNGEVKGEDIAGNVIDAGKLSSTLTFDNGDFLDLSRITHSSTAQMGLLLPNASSSTPSSPSSGEGYLAYDTAGNQLIVYDGLNWGTLTGTGDITSVTAGDGLSGGGASGAVTVSLNQGFTPTWTAQHTFSSATPISLSSTSPAISIGNTGTLSITDGTNDLLTLADNGTTGNLTVTGNVGVSQSLTVTSGAVFSSFVNVGSLTGAGLVSCSDGTSSKLLYNSQTGQFSCGSDQNTGGGGGTGGWIDYGSTLGLSTQTNNVGIGTSPSVANAKLQVQGAGNSTGLTFYTTNLANNTFGLVALDNGNIGIGTTLPDYNLKVNGTGYFSGFVGIGSSLSVTGNVGVGGSITGFGALNGLNVTGLSNLAGLNATNINGTTLTTSGNVAVGGSLTVTSGANLSGGLVVSAGSVVLPNGVINNSELENSSLTVTAGTGLTGGGLVSLGGSVTLNASQDISITATPTFDTLTLSGNNNALRFSGTTPSISTSNGSFSIFPSTGNVGIGTSSVDYNLKVSGTGYFSGFVGIGSSLSVTGNVGVGASITGFGSLSGLNVTGLTQLAGLNATTINGTTLTTSGNVSVGSSLTVTSGVNLSSGLKVAAHTELSTLSTSGNVSVGGSLTVSNPLRVANYSSCTSLETDSSGNLVCGTDADSGGTLTGSGVNGAVSFWDGGTSLSNSVSNFFWDSTNNRLGIGTSSPGGSLVVQTGNVGIGISAPSQVFQVNSGSSAFVITSSGNVGIGLTTPLHALDVSGNVGVRTSLTVTSLINTLGLNVTGTSSLGTAYASTLTVSGNLGVGSSITGFGNLTGLNVSGLTQLSGLNTSGNVGVGASLTVSSTGAFRLSGQNCSGLTNAGKLTTDSSGNVYCAADISGSGESTTASNGLTLSGSDVRLGGFLTQATAIDIASQNFGFLGGNVGIGTSTPDYNLRVNGTGYFSGFVGIGSSLSVTGNVGVGSSLTVTSASVLDSLSVTKSINGATLGISGASNLSGNVGVGASLTVTSAGVFSSGINVTGHAGLSTLSTSGNVNIGGSLTVTSGLSLPNSSILNANLVNSSLTVTAGTGLTGGGAVSLGGSVTLNAAQDISSTGTPTFDTLTLSGNNNALRFSGTTPSISTSNGSFSIFSQTGNVGIGTSNVDYNLKVSGTGFFSGFVGVGSSMNVSGNLGVGGSITGFGALNGLDVSGLTNLSGLNATDINGTTLTTSGNVSVGSSLTTTSGAVFSSFVNVGSLTGAGLVSCSDTTNSKLLYNSQTGQFTCGTDQNTGGGGGSGGWIDFGTTVGLSTQTDNVGIGTSPSVANAKLQIQGAGNSTGLAFYTTNSSDSVFGLVALDNGNVGVGTTLPDYNLKVNGTGYFTNFVGIGSSLSVTGNVGVGASLTVESNTRINSGLTVLSHSDLASLSTSGLILANGGLTVPNGQTLTANGVINLGDGGDAITLSGTTYSLTTTSTNTINLADNIANALDIQQGSDNYININTSNSSENITFGNTATNPRFIFSGGNVGIGSTAPGSTLVVAGNVNIGHTGAVSDALGLAVRGNVGIGTTTPLYPLHVIGNVGIGTSLTVSSLVDTAGLNVSGTSSLGTAYGSTLTVSGNVGLGSSLNVTGIDGLINTTGLKVSGFSDLSGNVGVGGTGIFNSLIQGLSGLTVNSHSSLATLSTSGNTNIGASLTVSSTGAFRLSGQNCSGLTNAGKLTTDSSGNVYCAADISGAAATIDGSGGAGQISFWTDSDTLSGNNAFYWNNSLNRLGVGSSAPGSTLGVFGSVGIGASYGFATLPSTANNGLVIEGNVGIGTSNPTAALYVANNVGIGWTGVNLSSSIPGLGLSVKGNVGVGTTSPAHALDVIGNVGVGTSLTVNSLINSAGLNISGTSSLGTAYAAGLTVSGNAGIGTSLAVNGVNSLANLTNLNVTGTSVLGTAYGSTLTVSGNVGLGSSLNVVGADGLVNTTGLKVSGFSDLSGNVGVGVSLNVVGTNGITNTRNLNVSGTSVLGTAFTSTLTSSGNVGLGSSLTVTGTNGLINAAGLRVSGFSDLAGNVGIGGTGIFNSLIQGSSLTVSSHSGLSTLSTTGNVSIGASLTVSSTGAFRLSGQNCSSLTNGGKLTTDSNGNVYCAADVAGSGSQTPWTSDIDADGFDLTDLSNIQFRETTGAPAGSIVSAFSDNTGDLNLNVLTGKSLNIQVNGTDEYSFSSTALEFNSNNITGVGTISTSGNTGVGGSLTVTSLAALSSGLTVSAHTQLSTLTTSGNTNIGGSLTATNAVKLDRYTSCTALETDSSGNLVCGSDDTGGGGSDNSGLENVQVFTTANHGADAYNESIAAITHILVELVGGGGGGGDGTASDGSGGGGAGGYSSELLTDSEFAANDDVTVGAGGAGGTADNAGSTGGTTSFGDGTADLSATGGSGGTVDANGGDGGVGSGGDINLNGGGGGSGTGATSLSGVGGSSYFGGGGQGVAGNNSGGAGNAPGSGGAGGAGNGNGGTGAEGIVIIWEYSGTAGSDYAEYYETEEEVEAADVVAMSDQTIEFESPTLQELSRFAILKKATKDDPLVGVVSTAPGITIGKELADKAKNPRPIALAGRVPVKVTNAGGPIKTGDPLTASHIPGVAMKASKAGQYIGTAMEDYTGTDGEIGRITVFINTGYSTGARTKELLAKQGMEMDSIPQGVDVGKVLLAQMIKEKKDIVDQAQVAEIATDRLLAGLEVISPRVLTDELVTNSIEAVEKDLTVKLVSDGHLIIAGEGEASDSAKPVVTFDSLGNATFAGTVTADKIRANQIEGLEFLLAEAKLELGNLTSTPSAQTIVIGNRVDQETASAEASLADQVLDKLNVGELHVASTAIFDGIVQILESLTTRTLIVTDWAHFLAEVIFKGDVFFEGRPTFNNDTAGFAVITKGADQVEVTFDKEYTQTPLVNISLTLDEMVSDQDRALLSPEQLKEKEASQSALEEKILVGDIRYIVTRRTNKGFVIKLNVPAPEELRFSWSALAVKDAKTAISSQSSVVSNILGTEVSPSATPIVAPSPSPTPNFSASPSPSPTFSPSPSATPQPSPEPSKEPETAIAPAAQTVTVNETELGFLRVRKGPGTSFEEVGQVEIGATFEIFEVSDPVEVTGQIWYQIEYEDNKYGWVSGAYVSVL